LYSWVDVKIKSSISRDELVLPCPEYKCTKVFSYEELKQNLTDCHFNSIDYLYLQRYLRTAEDVRFCPLSSCKYAGMILSKPCDGQLECDNCNTKWKDASQHTMWDKLENVYSEQRNVYHNFLSMFVKLTLSQACPNCSTLIIKSGGCRYMVCTNCEYEFCWRCLQNHDHQEAHGLGLVCGVRIPMLITLLLFITTLVNFKVCWVSSSFCNIEKHIAYYSFIGVITSIYLLQLWFFGYLLADELKRKCKQSGDLFESLFLLFVYVFVEFVCPLLIFYLGFWTICSFVYNMAITVVIGALAPLLIIGVPFAVYRLVADQRNASKESAEQRKNKRSELMKIQNSKLPKVGKHSGYDIRQKTIHMLYKQ